MKSEWAPYVAVSLAAVLCQVPVVELSLLCVIEPHDGASLSRPRLCVCRVRADADADERRAEHRCGAADAVETVDEHTTTRTHFARDEPRRRVDDVRARRTGIEDGEAVVFGAAAQRAEELCVAAVCDAWSEKPRCGKKRSC